MRSRWVSDEYVKAILLALTPQNRLACLVSYRYGMRIGDVLGLTRKQVKQGRFTYKEEKTGKSRRVSITGGLRQDLLANSGRVYVFEHRQDWKKHRTRQAVYKDIKRAAAAFRLKGVSPHSFRKCYAVHEYEKFGDLKRVQRLLNHSSEAVTMIYALADQCQKAKKS